MDDAASPAETVISRIYWELVGHGPEPDEVRALAQRLMDAVPVEKVRAEIARLPAALTRRDRLGQATTWKGDSWSVPYVVLPSDNRRYMAVTFTGLAVGETPPLPLALENDAVSRLAVGMGAVLPRTADEMADWSHEIADLVRVVAEDLGVRREDVSFCGPSGEGTYALLVGFAFGSGRVLAGAPGVKLGTWMMRLYDALKDHPSAGAPYVWSHARSGAAHGDDPVVMLDELIPRLAREVSEHVDVLLYASQDDFMYEDSIELLDRSAAWARVTVKIQPGDYPDHNNIRPAFRAFVLQELLGEHATG